MSENRIATTLFISGVIIIIIGFILGIANGVTTDFVLDDVLYDEFGEEVGYEETYNTFQFGPFFITAFGGFLLGMLFIGLSEIIRLLQRSQVGEPASISSGNGLVENMEHTDDSLRLIGGDRERIEELFPDMKKDVFATPYDGICVVVLQHEVADIIKVVDVAGFKAEEVQSKEIVEKVMVWYQKHLK